MRRRILLVLALAAACAVWMTTLASGAGPSPGLTPGPVGLTEGNLRYLALSASRTTEVQVVRSQSGQVLRHMRVQGIWGIPLVAYDGTAEGLFPNGRTLVLAQNLYQGQALRERTTFTLVDTRRMKVTRRIQLKGAFTFDAVSRNGRYLYLIEYMSPEDASYRVRVYDLAGEGLLARIVSDKQSWATDMRGLPIARTWKSNWAYTLYGANARPFIHALDTHGVSAVCINLPWKTSPDRIFEYRLRIDGDGHLVVRGPNGRALAVIDRQTFKIISFVANP
jgi:hypothetical protein